MQRILSHSRRIWERLDIMEGTFNLWSREQMDSVTRETDVHWFPPGADHSAFTNDVSVFLKDRESYGIVMSLFDAGGDMKRSRRRRIQEVRTLRGVVETALSR